MENGHIKEIDAFENLINKRGTTVIDCKGKYVIPGMFDMHMHIAEEENLTPHLYQLLKHGITGIRDMGGIADSVSYTKKRIKENTLLGPDIYFAGVTLDGPQSQDPFHVKVYDSTDISELALHLKSMGIDFFKVHNYIPRDKLMELKEVCEASDLKIVGHIPVGIGPMELDVVGLSCIEHINSLLSGIVLKEGNNVDTLEEAFMALDSTYISQFSAYVKAHKIAITPTLYAMYDMYSNLETEPSKTTGERLLDLFYNMIRWLNENKVLLLAGTDRGSLNNVNINELHEELAIMVKAGLSPLDALKTATINPAIFLGIDEIYGSVEINKKANLIILEGNPLIDIANTKTIYSVIKNGAIISDQINTLTN